jgi:hypothetical protein
MDGFTDFPQQGLFEVHVFRLADRRLIVGRHLGAIPIFRKRS